MAIDQLLHPYAGMRIDKVAGLEARGFILGGAIAHQLVDRLRADPQEGQAARAARSRRPTQLEYGEAVVEVHDDAMLPGETVLLVDDLLATGGTAEAGIKLIERLGAEVSAAPSSSICPIWAGVRSLRRWAWTSTRFAPSRGCR